MIQKSEARRKKREEGRKYEIIILINTINNKYQLNEKEVPEVIALSRIPPK